VNQQIEFWHFLQQDDKLRSLKNCLLARCNSSSLFDIYLFSALGEGFAAVAFCPSILIRALFMKGRCGNPRKMGQKERKNALRARDHPQTAVACAYWICLGPDERAKIHALPSDECSAGQCTYCLFCVPSAGANLIYAQSRNGDRRTTCPPKEQDEAWISIIDFFI
jgi:hypothetical protein